jgi:hypothetical protein
VEGEDDVELCAMMTAIDVLRRVVSELMANTFTCSSIQSYLAVCPEFILPEGHVLMLYRCL